MSAVSEILDQPHPSEGDHRPTPGSPRRGRARLLGGAIAGGVLAAILLLGIVPRVAQQHRALENDSQFRRLPPPQQMQLQNKLRHFSSLPPQQQERELNRMETWEHLTPNQKQQAHQIFQQFRQLPPDRRWAVNRAIRGMRGLTPEQRDRLINSEQYRRAFSPPERHLLDGASRLPLAPEGLPGESPQQ